MSYCAPRNASRSAGSCSASSWSVRARIWSASMRRRLRGGSRDPAGRVGTLDRMSDPGAAPPPSSRPLRRGGSDAPSACVAVAVSACSPWPARPWSRSPPWRRGSSAGSGDDGAAAPSPSLDHAVDHHDVDAPAARAAVQRGDQGPRTPSPGTADWRLDPRRRRARHRGLPRRHQRAAGRHRHALRHHRRADVHDPGVPHGLVPGARRPAGVDVAADRREGAGAGHADRGDQHLRGALGRRPRRSWSARTGRSARTS